MSNPVLAYADSYRAMARQGVERVLIWSVITDLERNIAPLFDVMREAPDYPHWNSPDVLPPVGCPIVLRIGCAVVQAERTAHIERRDREMTYQLPGGQLLTGRYEWSYP